MAAPQSQPHPPTSDYGSDIELLDDHSDDYGSDLDIDLTDSIVNLLDNSPALQNAPPPPPPVFTKPKVKTNTRYSRHGTLIIQYDEFIAQPPPDTPPEAAPSVLAVTSPILEVTPSISEATTPTVLPNPEDCSPYDRFRSRRGQLSVTDLISNVWCEQQFMYTLSRGRRTTPAMRTGTALHKVLEERVHTTVPVQISTHEDAWGLKLFNICQGLFTLQEQGMTRELDVFGWLEGVFVAGIIDEISYDASPGQLEGFVTAPSSPMVASHGGERTAYITDTKTRTSRTIPTGSQLKSTALQLMFYHHLLSTLPSVDFDSVLAHRGLNGDAPFSDTFIAQVASMESAVELEELLENNSLRGLWGVLLRRYKAAITDVGRTVGVCYVAQKDGTVIAERSWEVKRGVWEAHLEDVMMWWRGERMTKGVEVEEAWKCRACEFQEDCTWRLGKLEEMIIANRVKGKRKEGGEEKKVEVGGVGRKEEMGKRGRKGENVDVGVGRA